MQSIILGTTEQNRQHLYFIDEETESERLGSQFNVAQLEKGRARIQSHTPGPVLSSFSVLSGWQARVVR